MNESSGAQSAARLREAFDASFAVPFSPADDGTLDLLLARVASEIVAIPARETAGIRRCPPLTLLPSGNPALCGIAGVRGTLVAVYSLASLANLGPAPSSGGWIVACAGDPSAALLFEALVGHARVGNHAIKAPSTTTGEHGRAVTGEVVQIEGVTRSLLRVPPLLETLRQTAPGGAEI